MLESQRIPLDDVLFSACMGNNVNPIKFLMDRGAKLSHKNKDDRSLLHAACSVQGPTSNTVRYLIEQGLPVDATDRFGNTPLHLACESHNYKAIEILLAHSADANAQNNIGDTPLIYSAKNGRYHMKLYRMLMKYNVDPSKKNAEAKTFSDYISKQQQQSVLSIS